MPQLPETCPLCQGELVVTRFECRSCGTEFHGRFHRPRPRSVFDRLSPEQLRFLEVFIRNEGKFSRMEKELGLSYPTLRNRLRNIIQAMGFQPAEEEEESPSISPEERRRILDQLDQGRITVEEALRLLRGESPSSKA